AVFFMLLFDKMNIFLFVILSSVFHEIGHILASFILGHAPQIEISIFGIKLKPALLCDRKKFIILFCGPLVNLIIVIVCHVILSKHFQLRVYIFMCVNLIIMMFNLLPIHFLDGGQMLAIIANSYYIEKLMDGLSILFIFVIIFIFSEDIYYSICAASIFIIYFIANSINGI
ncbi:MAG: hypothetical protein RSA20_04700, partial [Oscillospiraceae bacterium]